MDQTHRREIGAKLRNFREKLSIALDSKKIDQEAFGGMFGGFTRKQITDYERGRVTMPADLLYLLWRSGQSIDGIFDERPISQDAAKAARELLEPATAAFELAYDATGKKAHRAPIAELVADQDSQYKKAVNRNTKARTYKTGAK